MPENIIQHVKALQVLLGTKPKRLHTDDARDQQVPELKQMMNDQGTQITTTSSNSLAQNGLVERRLRTFFAAVRTALATRKISKAFWSHAVLDPIDKANYTSTRRSSDFMPPKLKFFPYGQDPCHFQAAGAHGFIVNTHDKLPILTDRAKPARYLRSVTPTR